MLSISVKMPFGGRTNSRVTATASLLAALSLNVTACASGSNSGAPVTESTDAGGGSRFVDATTDSSLTGEEATAGGEAGTCVPHQGPPVLDPTSAMPCPSCSAAHCIPTALVPAASASM